MLVKSLINNLADKMLNSKVSNEILLNQNTVNISVEKKTFYLVKAKGCNINETVFIVLHITNNMVNIVQILACIVLSAFLELDNHMSKIHARALCKMIYAHFLSLGHTPVLRDQINDCSNLGSGIRVILDILASRREENSYLLNCATKILQLKL